jgi:hypothetical protein
VLRTLEINLDDLQRLLGLKGDGGTGFHRSSPAKSRAKFKPAEFRPAFSRCSF